jgi:hypothetical protein
MAGFSNSKASDAAMWFILLTQAFAWRTEIHA